MKINSFRSIEELHDWRARWEHWQSHINSDLGQFELVCRLRPEVESPFITVIEADDGPRALLVGRLERTRIAPTIGYFQPLRIRARVIAMIHHCVLGELDASEATGAVRQVWSLLQDGVADAVNFHHLPEDSELLQALWRDGPRWFCEKTPRWSTHREMSLPTDGSPMATKLRGKHRSRIRNRQKALADAFPGRIAWRWIKEVDDVAGLCRRLEEVAARTYQRGLGAGFFDNEEFRQRFELFATRKQLRVQILEIDGRIKAFWFGTVYRGIFNSSETGYDPDLREYEVGTLMFLRMVDELAGEGVERLDFGLGDALYKERFGDKAWRETSVWLFAPSVRGLALMLLLRFSFAVDRTARGIVARAGLTEKIKTFWRRRKANADSRPAAGEPS